MNKIIINRSNNRIQYYYYLPHYLLGRKSLAILQYLKETSGNLIKNSRFTDWKPLAELKIFIINLSLLVNN